MTANTFAAQLIALVRRMPDDAILALVRNQLKAISAAAPSSTSPTAAPKRGRGRPRKVRSELASRPKKLGRPVGSGLSRAEREAAFDTIERFVKASKGVSLGDIVKSTGFNKVNVKLWLVKLRAAKRVFLGGEKVFGRYAGDVKTALAASAAARRVPSRITLRAGSDSRKK